MSYLEQEFASLHRARTERELCAEAERFAKSVGFERFAYVMNVSELLPGFEPTIFTNYPSAWVDYYVAGNYFQADPLIRHARHSARAILWSDHQTSRDQSVREFWEEARAFGLVDGLSFGIHHRPGVTGMFSVCRNRPIDLERDGLLQLIGAVQTFAVELHDLVCDRRASRLPVLRHVELTRGQLAVMRWVVAGKTAEEIGQILSITKHGVVAHINKVKVSLQARNTAQAVARAVALGLVW